MAEHISSQFNQELETVRTMVMKMGGLVEQQLQNVIKGLEDTNSDLLQDVVAADRTVNEMEVNIDDQCQFDHRSPSASSRGFAFGLDRYAHHHRFRAHWR